MLKEEMKLTCTGAFFFCSSCHHQGLKSSPHFFGLSFYSFPINLVLEHVLQDIQLQQRMAPILERILTGKEPSPFILVKDTLEQSGQLIGFELLNNTPKEYGRQKSKVGRPWIQIMESAKKD